jgi:hypothetical protein
LNQQPANRGHPMFRGMSSPASCVIVRSWPLPRPGLFSVILCQVR